MPRKPEIALRRADALRLRYTRGWQYWYIIREYDVAGLSRYYMAVFDTPAERNRYGTFGREVGRGSFVVK